MDQHREILAFGALALTASWIYCAITGRIPMNRFSLSRQQRPRLYWAYMAGVAVLIAVLAARVFLSQSQLDTMGPLFSSSLFGEP